MRHSNFVRGDGRLKKDIFHYTYFRLWYYYILGKIEGLHA